MHYLDNAATTRVSPEAAEAAASAMRDTFGNPSSDYALGRDARALIDDARRRIAGAIGADDGELYFTSGGTEADNWALLKGAALGRRRGKHIVTTAAEHSAVLSAAKELESAGYTVTYVPPEPDGSLDPARLEAALRDDTGLVSVMAANNETGVDFPVEAIGALLRARLPEALFHVDAVQAFLKRPLDVGALRCDLLSLSAHKIHGPKGVGALYVKKGLTLRPFHLGGEQEGGMRPGTEPVPAIAAFGAAVGAALPHLDAHREKVGALRRRLLGGLAELGGVAVNASGGAIVNFSVAGYTSTRLINLLGERGVYVSAGSACHRGKDSHVLRAMGLGPERIRSAVRASLSRTSTEADVDALLEALRELRR